MLPHKRGSVTDFGYGRLSIRVEQIIRSQDKRSLGFG